jgi:hypothetical protein
MAFLALGDSVENKQVELVMSNRMLAIDDRVVTPARTAPASAARQGPFRVDRRGAWRRQVGRTP